MIPDIFGVTSAPLTRVCYLTDRWVINSSILLVFVCLCASLNFGFAWLLFCSLGFRNVRMLWVPLSRCVFLIPTPSLTSTRTSLQVSRQYFCRICSQEMQLFNSIGFIVGPVRHRCRYITPFFSDFIWVLPLLHFSHIKPPKRQLQFWVKVSLKHSDNFANAVSCTALNTHIWLCIYWFI